MKLKKIIVAIVLAIPLMAMAQQINPITQAMLDGYKQLLEENPKDYFTLYQRSAQYYRLSLYDMALTDIEKAISYTPAKEKDMLSQEYMLATDIYIEVKDYQKALNAVNIALENNPNNYSLLYKKGNVCLYLNELSEAKKSFAAMQRLRSRSQEAFFGLARVAILEQNYGLADTYMKEAENADPSNYITYCRLGDLCIEMKDYDKAAAHYLSAFGLVDDSDRPMISILNLSEIDYEATANAIDYAISKTENSTPLFFLRGNIAFKTSHFSDAYEAFRHLLDTEDGKIAPIYAKMADICYALNNQSEALNYINNAIFENNTTEYLTIKAKIELAMGNPNSAIIDIKNAILYDSFSTEALVIAALAYIDLKNYDEAINMLNNAIMNDAENPIPLMIRAYIYNNLIDNAKLAVADYSRVARIVDEDFPNIAYKAMAQTLLGKVLDGDATIRKALDKCPENANNQYLTAVYYAQSGSLELAKQHLDKSLELGYENEFNLVANKIVNLNIAPIRHLYIE